VAQGSLIAKNLRITERYGCAGLKIGGVMVGNKTVSLTDEIYAELVDGLKTDLDWTHFLAKHSSSKGPLYNAIGRFFHDMEPKVKALGEVQAKLDQAGLKLNQLDQKIKETDKAIQAKNQDIVALEEKGNTLKKQNDVLEGDLGQKGELLERLQELEEIGFGKEKLAVLHTTLAEIGGKRGLKQNEAVDTFFAELKDYDAKTGFEREIHRLETITQTKKLEAERWQAEADSLAMRHKDLSEAIAAIQSLIKQRVKVEQIVSWNGIVSKLGGPAELQDKLGQYKSMSDLLTAKKTEIESCDKKVTELSTRIKALKEQKAEIEAAIKSLSSSGVKEITKVSDEAMSVLKSLSNSGAEEITRVGAEAIAEAKSLLAEIRVETKRLADLKAEAGKLEKELMYARYITTTDESVLQSFPREVVLSFLDRAKQYCTLNNLNPTVRMPKAMCQRYAYIMHDTSVPLLDIVAWAEAGFAEA
jgi:chromosome segregation ATPase